MSEKIRECPFCGRPGRLYRYGGGDNPDRWKIVCEGSFGDGDCGAETMPWDHQDEAIADWARRPREERLVKLLRDARTYLRNEETNLAAGMVLKIDAELGET